MNNHNGAVKHNETVLFHPKLLEYPGESVAEVRPTYYRTFPPRVLPLITSPLDAGLLLKQVWKTQFDYAESVYALYLNGANRTHAWSLIAEGTVNKCYILPQKILTLGLLTNSAGFILAHNHPSGSRGISESDKSATVGIVKGAMQVGLTCFDHLVLSSLDEKPLSIRAEYPSLFTLPQT